MLKYKTINPIFQGTVILLLVYAWIERFPLLPFLLLLIGYGMVIAYGSFVLSTQFFLPVLWKAPDPANSIAITFDDGPVPERTEQILDILGAHQIPAAFFCIGNQVAENPEIAKRIHDAGHVLGNHSYWHRKTFDFQSGEKIEKELAETDDIIRRTTGVKPKLFRPPYGVTNPMVAKAVKRRGYHTIGWSIRSFDRVIQDSTSLLKRVTRSLKPGDVIVFHDTGIRTAQILPALFEHAEKLGLKIVRLDDLLKVKAYG